MKTKTGNALLIEPDEGKSKLMREVLGAFEGINKTERSSNLQNATRFIQDQAFHFMFISDSLPKNKIDSFHIRLREQPWSKDCTIILLTPTAEQARTNLIKKLLDKAHGVLCEPFSLDSLRESLIIAAQVKSQADAITQAKLIQIALVDAMTFIDARSTLMQKGVYKSYSSNAIRKLKQTLTDLHQQYPDIYFDTIVDRFAHVAETTVPNNESYSGVSNRVKKKMEKKIQEKLLESLEDLEQQCGKDD